jgi:hypothetical protein
MGTDSSCTKTKKAAEAALCNVGTGPDYLQLPGRNLAGNVPPQVQVVTTEPTIVGVRVRVVVSIAGSPKPCAVTVIMPVPSVVTDATYFDGDDADSQPQAPAPGKDPDEV